MTEISDTLVLHLTFSDFVGKKIRDVSEIGHDIHIDGAPDVVGDPMLGTALDIRGKGDLLTAKRIAGGIPVGDMTISMWLRAAPTKYTRFPLRFLNEHDDALSLGEDGTLTYASGKKSGGVSRVSSQKKVKAEVWTHIAVVRDLTNGRISWFVDGWPTGSGEFEAQEQANGSVDMLLGDGGEASFAGKLAHVRVYMRPLDGEEIRRDRDLDQTVRHAFHETQPLGFSLSNSAERNVLHSATHGDPGQVSFELRNEGRRELHIMPDTEQSAADSGVLELLFRPGTLTGSSPGAVIITTPGWTMDHAFGPNNVVRFRFTPGDSVKIAPGDSISLILKGLTLTPAGGTRATNVELTYRNLSIGQAAPISGTRHAHVAILFGTVGADAPLFLDTCGVDGIVNDGKASNKIILRVTNIQSVGEEPVRFNPSGDDAPTRFILRFVADGKEQPHPNAIGKVDQVGGFQVSVNNQQVENATPEAPTPSWVIEPNLTQLASGDSLLIEVSSIVTDASAGPTPVQLDWENLPGIGASGTLSTTIQKGGLIVSKRGVGLGTQNPVAPLHVAGADHQIFLSNNKGDSGAKQTARAWSLTAWTDGDLYVQSRSDDGKFIKNVLHATKEGDLYVAGKLKVGGEFLTKDDLNVIKLLARGKLKVNIFNQRNEEYAYASDVKKHDSGADNARRYIFTWSKSNSKIAEKMDWVLMNPRSDDD